MTKRAIPAGSVRTHIDDLSYHHAPERDQLSDKGLLFSFIDKWEINYFFILRTFKKSTDQEDNTLSEEEINARHTHSVMRQIQDDMRNDLY